MSMYLAWPRSEAASLADLTKVCQPAKPWFVVVAAMRFVKNVGIMGGLGCDLIVLLV